NAATGCASFTTLTLTVSQGPPTFATTPLVLCDPNSDGYTTFDLTPAGIQAAGGGIPAGVSVSYHETLTDAQTGGEPITPSNAYPNIDPYLQTVFIRVVYDATGCYSVQTVELIINDTPIANDN